jgi:hypothetical protein
MNVRAMKRASGEWRVANSEWRAAHPFAIRHSLLAFLALALAPGEAEAFFVPHYQAAWPALANSSSYTSACSRLMFPLSMSNEGSPYDSFIADTYCVSPPYTTTNLRAMFADFYVNATGVANPESCNGNSVHVDFATIFVNAPGGAAYPLGFGGALGIQVNDCGFVWSDPVLNGASALSLPPNTAYIVRISETVAANANLSSYGGLYTVNGPISQPFVGDAIKFYTSPQTSLRLSGTYTTKNGALSPAMIVAQGWNGTGAYLVAGDSIGRGLDDPEYAAPSLSGYIEHALADTGSGARNFYVSAVDGSRPDDQASIAKGQYLLRMRALRSIPNVPFNQIISEMGQNSPSVYNNTTIAPFEIAMASWWSFWHTNCPSCGLFQTTFPSRAQALNNSKWTTQADQTSDYPGGVRWQADACIANGSCLASYVTPLNVTPAATTSSGFTDNPGNWPTSGYSGTLAAALSATGATSVSISATAPPPVGSWLALEPGTSNVDVVAVLSVAGSSSPYTATTGATAKTHALGASVGVAFTYDGTHVAAPLIEAMAGALTALKGTTLP